MCTEDPRIWGFVDDLSPLLTSGVKLRALSLLASVSVAAHYIFTKAEKIQNLSDVRSEG